MSCQPPPFAFYNFALLSFHARAEAASQGFDLACTSWWRTPLENARVGGDPFSQHLVGWAVDAAGPDMQQFSKQARMTGLTTVLEADHVHVQLFPAGVLRRLLVGY